MRKNELDRLFFVLKRLYNIRTLINNAKDQLQRRCYIPENARDIEIQASIALLNLEQINLNLELDDLLKLIQVIDLEKYIKLRDFPLLKRK